MCVCTCVCVCVCVCESMNELSWIYWFHGNGLVTFARYGWGSTSWRNKTHKYRYKPDSYPHLAGCHADCSTPSAPQESSYTFICSVNKVTNNTTDFINDVFNMTITNWYNNLGFYYPFPDFLGKLIHFNSVTFYQTIDLLTTELSYLATALRSHLRYMFENHLPVK